MSAELGTRHPDDLDDAERAALLERLRQERDGTARWSSRWVHDHQPLSRTDRAYPATLPRDREAAIDQPAHRPGNTTRRTP